MSYSDLPLFAWQPPRTVVVFPLINRIGKVRHTAGLLLNKCGEDAALYRKQVVAANRKHLKRVGIADDEIDQELRSFFDAVQAEMLRLAYQGHGTGGTAA